MGLIVYNLFLLLYKTGISLVSPWNFKAKLWVKGRINILNHIKTSLENRGNSPLIWMHCASLGEFEQGRPVLESIKTRYPDVCILLTFFSPSGYEVRKNYEGADYIFYLPSDSQANAKAFLDIIKPQLVLWVKYEYWYYFLTEIKKNNIPLLLVSGTFRREQLFFKKYGNLHRRMLECFSHIFVQTDQSRQLLSSIGFAQHVTVSGDTRFDRVIQIAEKFTPVPLIKEFCGDHKTIIAGSTWNEDEEELDHFANIHPEIRFIIAPHQIDEPHLQQIEKLYKHSIRYSTMLERSTTGNSHAGDPANVLVIDNIGMLSRLYYYSTISYIGGGFGAEGVHNVLEAAVFAKPVVFGPIYRKFVEAEDLVIAGGAFTIENALELEKTLTILLTSSQEYRKACEAARNYVHSNKGAKDKITEYIIKNELLIAHH